VLKRAEELGGNNDDNSAQVMAAFLYAWRGQRDKVDPTILKSRPTEVIDGDLAYWTGGIHALLGEREQALAWLRRAVEIGNHNDPRFQKDKTAIACAVIPNASASWKKCGATGKSTNGRLGCGNVR
jgi:hypothetical protein